MIVSLFLSLKAISLDTFCLDQIQLASFKTIEHETWISQISVNLECPLSPRWSFVEVNFAILQASFSAGPPIVISYLCKQHVFPPGIWCCWCLLCPVRGRPEVGPALDLVLDGFGLRFGFGFGLLLLFGFVACCHALPILPAAQAKRFLISSLWRPDFQTCLFTFTSAPSFWKLLILMHCTLILVTVAYFVWPLALKPVFWAFS